MFAFAAAVTLVAAFASQNPNELRVTLTNRGRTDILIPLGIQAGTGAHILHLKPQLKTSDGQRPEIIYTGLGFIAGYAAPLTIGLLAGESYTLSLNLDRYYVLQSKQTLTKFLSQEKVDLSAELQITDAECPSRASLDSMRRNLPCWKGKATSNIVRRYR